MNVFMSYWSIKEDSTFIYNCNSLSLYLAKKHYGNVHLVTDSNGKNALKSLPFSSVITTLDSLIPNKFWALGKIHTYKYAASLKKRFFHLDSDLFLWEKLPNDIENSDVFFEEEEKPIMHYNHYPHMIPFLEKFPKFDVLFDKKYNNKASNMCIVGGENFSFFEKYCNEVINISTNPLYYSFFEQYPELLSYSTVLEQFVFWSMLKKNKINYQSIYNSTDNTSLMKYTHLGSAKSEKDIQKDIQDRVLSRCIEFNIPYK